MKIIIPATVFAVVMLTSNVQALPNLKKSNDAFSKGTSSPLAFIENKGQVTDQNHQLRPDIQFMLKAAPGLNIFIGNGAIHYQFSKPLGLVRDKFVPAKHNTTPQPGKSFHPENHGSDNFCMYRLDVELLNANPNAKIITEEKQAYYENYYNENTGVNGATAHAYKRITYKNIYPFIDWILYTKNGQLEHEFVVRDGGNANDIRLKYGGATNLKINEDGSLNATTPQGVITEQAPKSFQGNGEEVKSGFKLEGDILTYETGKYTGALLIDPTLQWGTFFGSTSGSDEGYAVATDDSLNVYMAGATTSTVGIATTGAFQTTISGTYPAPFISKFDSLGALIWATYYSDIASSWGEATSLAMDRSGNFYVAGTVNFGGTTLLATPGAYQTSAHGGADAFIAKFTSAGFRIWGSYFGGPYDDYGGALAIDDSTDVYMAGFTSSRSGIASHGAYQTSLSGSTNAFLAKFNSSGGLKWSTYYGGENRESGSAVVTDSFLNVYLSGQTSSTTGIATLGSFQSTNNGGYDLFLAKFTASGTRLWATYFGGDTTETGGALAISPKGDLYLLGTTTGSAGLATPGAYKTTFSGSDDPFLVKFNSNGNRVWSTYYSGGANALDNISGGGGNLTTDGLGNVYITGCAQQDSSLSTPGAYETMYSGSNPYSAYLGKFDSTGVRLWGTYYGNHTIGSGITTDRNNNLYLTGETRDSCGIATPGAFQTVGDPANVDAYLAKFSPNGPPAVYPITGSGSVCTNANTALHDITTGGVWSSANTNIATVNSSGIVTGLAMGTDTISYTVNNNCAISSVIFPVTVHQSPAPIVSANGITTFCQGDSVTLTASPGNKYEWNNSDTAQSIIVKSGGSYTVVVTDTNSCSATSAATTVTVNEPVFSQLNHTICQGDSFGFNHQSLTQSGVYFDSLLNINGCDSIVTLTLTVDSVTQATIVRNSDTLGTQNFASYQWALNGTVMRGDTTQNIVAVQDGDYTVIVSNANGCRDTSAPFSVIGLRINDFAWFTGFKFYPNPNNGDFTLEFNDDVIREIEITDEIGKAIIAPIKVERLKHFNLETLSTGVYFLRINRNGEMKNLKFSVVR